MTLTPPPATMRIGELARLTGASARSLRYYEQQGLIRSARSGGGQRYYAATEVARVHLIRRLFDAGLGSKVIAQLLPCVDSDDADIHEEAFGTMVRERDRLTADISRLVETRDSLNALIEANTRHRPGAGRCGPLPAGGGRHRDA